jgi:hypothetical protein
MPASFGERASNSSAESWGQVLHERSGHLKAEKLGSEKLGSGLAWKSAEVRSWAKGSNNLLAHAFASKT